ncbi:hypothetical protein QIU19_13360 [Capnocytophaga canimorsus]|nr:hypothetical protein [Capnocytophaga canimorsus]WGU68233.1 hypothetical protein QIU19_13360 [Capnocytophaga canimorsus]
MFEIIGHEIMLNDVLVWLKIKTGCDISKGRYAVLPNGEFVFIEYEQQEGFDIVKTFISWNLSSPYLKDQSEELIKFLYDIKNK